jgi:hypothetical protein
VFSTSSWISFEVFTVETIIVCVLAYIVVVGLFNTPKHRSVSQAKAVGSMPINYFPEVEQDEEEGSVVNLDGAFQEALLMARFDLPLEFVAADIDYPCPELGLTGYEVVEQSSVATKLVKAFDHCVEVFSQPIDLAVNYSTMSIRELKAEAKKLTGTSRAIKGYSRLTKSELIARLSAQ